MVNGCTSEKSGPLVEGLLHPCDAYRRVSEFKDK